MITPSQQVDVSSPVSQVGVWKLRIHFLHRL